MILPNVRIETAQAKVKKQRLSLGGREIDKISTIEKMKRKMTLSYQIKGGCCIVVFSLISLDIDAKQKYTFDISVLHL